MAEKGKIENSNISRDVEQKLKIWMVFGWGTRGDILNISWDVEQQWKEKRPFCRSIPVHPGPSRGHRGAIAGAARSIAGPVQRNARGRSGLLGLTEAE